MGGQQVALLDYERLRSKLVPAAEKYADKALGIDKKNPRDYRWDRLFLSTMDLMTKREILNKKIEMLTTEIQTLYAQVASINGTLEG